MNRFSNVLQTICYTLIIIGAINWGLVGIFGFNLVSYLLGEGWVARTIYILIGVSALVSLFLTVRYTVESREEY